jgi:uncharacterized protein YukE
MSYDAGDKILVNHEGMATCVKALDTAAGAIGSDYTKVKGKGDTLEKDWQGDAGGSFAAYYSAAIKDLEACRDNLTTCATDLANSDKAVGSLDTTLGTHLQNGQ